MKAEIISEKYPSGDIVVAAINGKSYSLDLAGTADASSVIQKMIDDCALIGGGVVYLPEGIYDLKSYLTIKTGVTLRGEWINPDREENNGRGTILCCYCGKDDENGTPQITMEACTGLANIALYYSEQDIHNPSPYSPTVRQKGIDSITLRNVTIVNPWIGVQCGSDGNELHYLKNVYISPLNIGMFMDMTTDIGRLQNLYISPKYYEQFTLKPDSSPMTNEDKNALRDYMLANATGVYMGRSDWEYGYNIYIEGCKIGFTITAMKSGGPNTQISQLNMHNCDIGFKLINVNPYGVALSDSSITADADKSLTAAIVSGSTFETVMQLNGVDLRGGYEHLVIHEGKGQLSFVNCLFENNKLDGSAILQKNGGLSVLQCSFKGEGLHFEIEDGVTGTQILGCEYQGGICKKIGGEAEKEVQFSDEPLNLPVAPRGGHKPYPYSHLIRPASNLYIVDEFGAVNDGKTDNTKAFQDALDKASETGGIVYVPAGLYKFDGDLTIPSGVELRGTYDVPCHTMGGGSILEPFNNRGDENAKPFITLKEKSGVKGVLIHYPEQDPTNPVEYPWSIQSQGNFCYVIDTVFINSWLGLDFGTYGSENHYVSYISGAPIRCGIFVGNNSKEGWLENIQYNPHYWYRSSLPNKPHNNTWKSFWHNQIKYLDALKFGYNEQVHLLGTFVFAAKHGLYFVEQDGKGTRGKFIGHGTDGGEQGLNIDGYVQADLINTELVTIESPNTRIYLAATENAKGRAVFYNTLMWGAPHYAVVIDGGDVELQQINYVDQGKMANTVNGGSLKITGAYFYENSNHLEVDISAKGGNANLTGNMTVKSEKERSYEKSPMDIHITKLEGGTVEEKLNWSK